MVIIGLLFCHCLKTTMYHPKKSNQFGKIIGEYDFCTSKVVCVGRNYAAHAKELNNAIPETPLLFIKSSNTLVDLDNQIFIPKNTGECHHELEIAILIGRQLTKANIQQSKSGIEAVGLALDLTLRELQSELKSKGQPWEKAKSFDGACPMTGFMPIDNFPSLSDISFSLQKNKILAQKGNSKNMLFDIVSLISQISDSFTLYRGDIILTGTPEGVASLNPGDRITLELEQQQIATAVIS